MARRPRIHIPGCFYHVIARGNARQAIFFEEADYLRFLALLEDALAKYGHRLHAFCLMTNHAHLLLQMEQVPVSMLAHSLMSRYARWQNLRLGRSGHLFERRHRSILVHTGEQLLRLLRYLHRNPVRAGLASDCAGYRWSSHRAYLGQHTDIQIDTDCCLSAFDPVPVRARERYRAVVDAPDDGNEADTAGLAANEGLAMAEAAIRRSITSPPAVANIGLPALVAVAAECSGCAAGELMGSSMDRRVTRARAVAAIVAIEHPRLTLAQLAVRLQRDPSTLSEAAERFRRRAVTDAHCRRLLLEVRNTLEQRAPVPP